MSPLGTLRVRSERTVSPSECQSTLSLRCSVRHDRTGLTIRDSIRFDRYAVTTRSLSDSLERQTSRPS